MKKVNNPREMLESLFLKAIESAQPEHCIPKFLPENKLGKLVVIGAGKASAAMARVVENFWEGELTGIVVTRYGYGVPCSKIDIVEASHPVPDASGLNAAQRILELAETLSQDDTVLCLISGGGSALLPLPLSGITLSEKQEINKQLLRSGASISEVNCVRRHLSKIKGGGLAAACYPAKVITLMISDVPGDDPKDIASGPTVPDSTTCQNALDILVRYRIKVPQHIIRLLECGCEETIKPDDCRLFNNDVFIIATPRMALEAAVLECSKNNLPAYILSDSIEGEAKDVGKVMAAISKQIASHNSPFQKPCVLLSGGETTVTVKGHGKGGRNVEYLLSLGLSLQGLPGVYAIAGDTDGVDGREEIAGAFLSPATLDKAYEKGISCIKYLDNNDGHTFFELLGDSIVTGPTLTNVNDFRAIYIE